jgi:serine/threonine protein kinase
MLLKSDVFGTVTRIERPTTAARLQVQLLVCRDTRPAKWWVRWLARHLARREARALRVLAGIPSIPALIEFDGRVLLRTWIPAEPMQNALPRDAAYFRAASTLVRRLHRARVAHNDLAKEPNWLVTPQGRPALVDFQLASVSKRRGRLFRSLARDDIRHLLKHKRTYCPERLTARERHILATPSLVSRAWMATGKKVYLFVTRRLLGWADREGAGDRVSP